MHRPATVSRLLVSHALAATVLSVPWPLLLVEVHAQIGNGWLLGVVGAGRLLPGLTLSWATGRLADRWSRSRIVLATLWLRVLLLTATALALHADALALAAALATLAAAVATPAYPALAAAMPQVSGGAGDRATALLVTIEVASFAVGPALGGLLLPTGVLGVSVAMVGGTLGALLAFGRTQLARPEPGAAGEQTAYPLRRLVTVAGPIRRAVWLMGGINAVTAGVGIALITLAIDGWAGDETSYGVAAALLGLGSLAGPMLSRTGCTNAARMVVCAATLGVLVLAVAAAPSLAWATLPLALAGAAAVQAESAATGVLQENLPAHQLAGVLGAADSVMIGSALATTLVAPLLTEQFGAPTVIAAGGILMGAGARLARAAERGAPLAAMETPAEALSMEPRVARRTGAADQPLLRITGRPGASWEP